MYESVIKAQMYKERDGERDNCLTFSKTALIKSFFNFQQ